MELNRKTIRGIRLLIDGGERDLSYGQQKGLQNLFKLTDKQLTKLVSLDQWSYISRWRQTEAANDNARAVFAPIKTQDEQGKFNKQRTRQQRLRAYLNAIRDMQNV